MSTTSRAVKAKETCASWGTIAKSLATLFAGRE